MNAPESGEKRPQGSTLSPTAFMLLMLESCPRLPLNEDILHSLAFLVQCQMEDPCRPDLGWNIRANLMHSPEIEQSLELARKQGLVPGAPEVALTETGQLHCTLMGASVEKCKNHLREATVSTIGLSKGRLHLLCIAAAALASGLAEEVSDPTVKEVIHRHAWYMNKAARIQKT